MDYNLFLQFIFLAKPGKKIDSPRWASCHFIVNEKRTMLLRPEVINWFENPAEFIHGYEALAEYY